MVGYIPPPDARSLLPPLLACLPASFVSSRPPPALLSLLSPILRQRLELLNDPSSSSDTWLALLCWDSNLAQILIDTVSDSDAFEPHPTSGEIEIGSIEPVKYRRLDDETLHARLAAPDIGLAVTTLWCESEKEEEDDGWLIAELRPLESDLDPATEEWYSSMRLAEEKFHEKAFEEAVKSDTDDAPSSAPKEDIVETADEDSYWASYDKTPGPTPGADQPPSAAGRQVPGSHARTASEADYFERYATVQPEMDNDDPTQDTEDIGESTLHGNTLASPQANVPSLPTPDRTPGDNAPNERSSVLLNQPAAAFPASGSVTVSRLEHIANTQAGQFAANPSIRQHASTSIKSLFRLCQSIGVDQSQFEDFVHNEIQILREGGSH